MLAALLIITAAEHITLFSNKENLMILYNELSCSLCKIAVHNFINFIHRTYFNKYVMIVTHVGLKDDDTLVWPLFHLISLI